MARKSSWTYPALDGHYNPGLWTRAEESQSGADTTGYYSGALTGGPGTTAYIQTYPIIEREVDSGNGSIKSLKRSSGASWIKQDFNYPEWKGLPGSIAVTGSSDLKLNTDVVGIQRYGYDTFLQLNSIQQVGAPFSASREMNSFGKPNSITFPDGLTHRYEWDSLGRLKGLLPPTPEFPTHLDYPGFRGVNVTKDLQLTKYTFNAFGEVVREVRQGGPSTFSHRKFGYDRMGRKTWETVWMDTEGTDTGWEQPYGPGDSFTPGQDAWEEVVPTQVCLREEPDPSGYGYRCAEWGIDQVVVHHGAVPPQLVSMGSGITRYFYDEYGRPGTVVTPNDEVTQTTYQGLLKTITAGLVWSSGAVANPASPQSTAVTQVITDELGRMVQIIDAKGQPTLYFYDEQDRLSTVQQRDPGSGATQVRTWKYSGLGWLRELVQPESGTTTYSNFDVNGKPWVTNFNGRDVNSTFDPLGRLRRIAAADGSVDQIFNFDEGGPASLGNGKMTSTLTNGVTRALSYNGANGLNGRLTGIRQVIDGQTWTQTFGYNPSGSLHSRTLISPTNPGGARQEIQFDPYKALPNGTSRETASFATLPTSGLHWGLEGITYSNGATSIFKYGADQVRLNSMKHLLGMNVLKDWVYRYDRLGRMESDGEDRYGYDPLGRLTSALVRDLSPATMRSQGSSNALLQNFDYDAFGNRKLLTTMGVTNWPYGALPPAELQLDALTGDARNLRTYAMNSAELAAMAVNNRLPASVGGVPTGIGLNGYDAQGNLLQVQRFPGSTVDAVNSLLTMSYDALGRVKTMADGSLNRVEVYSYDDQGLRVLVEVYQGPVAPQNLQKKQYRIYNEARQLVSEYELVQE